jgi:hypothetical protein
MIINNDLINSIAQFCFDNKITLEISLDGDNNHVFIDKEGEVKKMTINIVNEKDKRLNEMIENGYNELKQFVNEFPTK